MTIRILVTALWAILGMMAVTVGATDRQVAGAADAIVELPISFHVVNTNTSGVACPSDGLPYTVEAHLVGPQSIIYGPTPRALTVYVHGFSSSEHNWSFTLAPG